jgi:hypothetical protein
VICLSSCVEIETVYDSENSKGAANGTITVKEIRDNVTIDYEEFETLYLAVRVRDLNTVYGDDYDEGNALQYPIFRNLYYSYVNHFGSNYQQYKKFSCKVCLISRLYVKCLIKLRPFPNGVGRNHFL